MSLETRILALASAVGADVKTLTTNQGNLASLSTTAKSNLVAAINEVLSKEGDLTTLTTTTQASLVAALNEVASELGNIASLTTTDKSSTVGAINELASQIVSLQSGAAGVYTNATSVPTTIGGIASGSTFSSKTWQEMFTSLLYPYQNPTFSSFGFTGQATPLEVGATITANRTFTWGTTNATNISTNTIKIQYPVGTDKATSLANDGTETVTHAAIQRTTPGTETFRIIGTNTNAITFQRDASVEWRWMKFSDNSALAGPLSAVQIQALATQSLVTSGAATYTFSAVGGTYKYIAYPASFGTLTTFKDQSTNLDVPMQTVYTVSVTNSFGQTTNYNVHRTTNQLGAAINIVAS